MNFGLVLKSEFDRQKHLFSQLYKTLDLSPEKKEAHQQEIIQLAKEQIKLFGGNFLDPKDQKRAIDRVLKLVNLGLEYASRKTEGVSDGKIFDLVIAQRILTNKSLVQLYQLGHKLFEDDSKIATALLEKSEIKIGDLFFRLISNAEYAQLKSLADIEHCDGILAEHTSAARIAFDLSKKYKIVPFLPINDSGLMIFNNFGGRQKNTYPTNEGLIDCLLLSLLIACMFRNKENLFNFVDTQEAQEASELFQTLIQKNPSKEELEWAVQANISIRRSACEDEKSRASNPESQKIFLRDILTVSPEEVAQFADTLFFESSIFSKKVAQIEQLFLGYFHLVREVLRIKEPAHFNNIIINALHSTERRIAEEVKNFYRTLNDIDITNEKINNFWHQRVCFKHHKKEGSNKGIASKAQSEIQPKQLIQMPVDYIVAAVRYFINWPEENKKIFIDNLNPNRFINEGSDNSENLIQFLKYISSGIIGGSAIYQEAAAICKKETSWVEIVVDKINWSRVHPSVVSELWQNGTDEIRDALWRHREKFKISIPAFKKYYVFEHNDLRLLEYILDRMLKEEKIKQHALDELLFIAQNLPKAKRIIKLKLEKRDDNKRR